MNEQTETAAALERLQSGRIEMGSLVSWGSNYTFLVQVCHAGGLLAAVYKPGRGERPLWDFARGSLCLRERAAYLISEQLGWGLVPPTVLRDGPYGRGSLQLFVEHDPEQHYLTLQGKQPDQARRIALFDVLINNADRKSGHVLLGNEGQLWAIDHGVSFHSDYKLRTIIWEFAGQAVPAGLLDDLVALHSWLCYAGGPVYTELGRLLSAQEVQALRVRLEQLLDSRLFPKPAAGRHYPWPLV
ncbi:MAG: SCO1664 family protein [Candidatus Promineifilaceae bacterium]